MPSVGDRQGPSRVDGYERGIAPLTRSRKIAEVDSVLRKFAVKSCNRANPTRVTLYRRGCFIAKHTSVTLIAGRAAQNCRRHPGRRAAQRPRPALLQRRVRHREHQGRPHFLDHWAADLEERLPAGIGGRTGARLGAGVHVLVGPDVADLVRLAGLGRP